MTIMLRLILILVSAGTMTMMIQKIRRAKLQIEDAIFWMLVSFMFVVFSLFPPVADFLAHMLGIYATVNFLFLFMIFLLLMRVFSMTIRISQLETKLKDLAQQMALDELAQKEQQTAADGPKMQERPSVSGGAVNAAGRSEGAVQRQREA